MERVCERVLVIHRGRLLLDRPVDALRKSFIPRKRISVVSEEAELVLDLPGVRRLRARRTAPSWRWICARSP